MNLVQKTRQFLADQKIDYLLVNATNEFLVEYSDLSENARYHLTKFSGSAGDALISQNDLVLFVDGRYHEQADLEVDKKNVTVVKMKLSQTFSECFKKKIKSNKTLAIVSKKNSQGRLEVLQGVLSKKNVEIKLLDFDPVMDLVSDSGVKIPSLIENVGQEIAGVPADEKFEKVSGTIQPNEAILTTNLEEISYICNLRDFSVNYSSKIKAKCLIRKDIAVLFVDENIKEFSTKFKIEKLKDFENYIKNLDSIDKFLVDKTTISAHDYGILSDRVGFLDEHFIKEMKSIKNSSEIEHYKKCFERADKALLATREYIEKNDGISEYDIEKKLEESFYQNGAKSLSFKSIVAKDKNSALAHYSKSSKDEILSEGSLVLIDCGAYFEGGYATDMTRVFVKGQPSALQKTVYTTVLKGFLAAFNKKINPKTSGYTLDKAARKILDTEAPRGFSFSHSLGHGIGINVHESPPTLSPSALCKVPLKPNMCFTIEPGLYKKSFGGVRLENSCYLEETIEQDEKKLVIKSFSNMCFEKKLIDFTLLSPKEKKWVKAFDLR